MTSIVGIVLDDGLTNLHKCLPSEVCFEKPERTEHIIGKLTQSDIFSKLKVIKPRKASKEEVCMVHSEEYVNEILSGSILKRWNEILSSEPEDPDDYDSLDLFYVKDHTPEACLLSCGSTIQMVQEVLKKKAIFNDDEDTQVKLSGNTIEHGVVIFRPPSHHALFEQPMGYCFFNSVVTSAVIAQKEYGAKKIAIFDWDVHHGNGTQDLRKKNENILYISTHRDFYPWTGDNDNIGTNGNTINIQFTEKYGDPEFVTAVEEIIIPSLQEFDPDLLLISAGFDSALDDPFGQCKISFSLYGSVTRRLRKCLSRTPIVVVLEGGYNFESTSTSVLETIKGLLFGEEEDFDLESEKFIGLMKEKCCESARKSLDEVKNIQKKYFKCFL